MKMITITALLLALVECSLLIKEHAGSRLTHQYRQNPWNRRSHKFKSVS